MEEWNVSQRTRLTAAESLPPFIFPMEILIFTLFNSKMMIWCLEGCGSRKASEHSRHQLGVKYRKVGGMHA